MLLVDKAFHVIIRESRCLLCGGSSLLKVLRILSTQSASGERVKDYKRPTKEGLYGPGLEVVHITSSTFNCKGGWEMQSSHAPRKQGNHG